MMPLPQLQLRLLSPSLTVKSKPDFRNFLLRMRKPEPTRCGVYVWAAQPIEGAPAHGMNAVLPDVFANYNCRQLMSVQRP